MAVLTTKEFELKSAQKKIAMSKSGDKQLQAASSPDALLKIEKVEDANKLKTFVFFHPENPADHYLNFNRNIKIGEQNFKINCINGMIRTNEIILSNYLQQKGYCLFDTEGG